MTQHPCCSRRDPIELEDNSLETLITYKLDKTSLHSSQDTLVFQG